MNKFFLISTCCFMVSLIAADKKDTSGQEHATCGHATVTSKKVFLVGFTLGSTSYAKLNYQEALELLEAQDDKSSILTNVKFKGYIERKRSLQFAIPEFPELSKLMNQTERICEAKSKTSHLSVKNTLEYIKEQYKKYDTLS